MFSEVLEISLLVSFNYVNSEIFDSQIRSKHNYA